MLFIGALRSAVGGSTLDRHILADIAERGAVIVAAIVEGVGGVGGSRVGQRVRGLRS